LSQVEWKNVSNLGFNIAQRGAQVRILTLALFQFSSAFLSGMLFAIGLIASAGGFGAKSLGFGGSLICSAPQTIQICVCGISANHNHDFELPMILEHEINVYCLMQQAKPSQAFLNSRDLSSRAILSSSTFFVIAEALLPFIPVS
jgi:hypothetical protein